MIYIEIDAACNGRPFGEAGLGILIRYQQQQIPLQQYVAGPVNNHQAEFLAAIAALQYIQQQNWQHETVVLKTDSQVLAQALERLSAKNTWQHAYLEQLTELIAPLPLFLVKQVSDRANKTADQLARQALYRKQ